MSETMMKGRAQASSVAPAGGSAGGRATVAQTPTDAAAWWQQHDQRVYQCIKLWVEQWYPPERGGLTEAVGEVFADHRASVREAIQTSKSVLSDSRRLATLKSASLGLPMRPSAGPRFRRASCWLRSRANGIGDLDAGARGLAERVGELGKSNSLEASFTKLAHEVKRRSEIPQSELLLKIDGLQRQVDELSRVADLDARFRELAERVGELEKTNSLEARLTKGPLGNN